MRNAWRVWLGISMLAGCLPKATSSGDPTLEPDAGSPSMGVEAPLDAGSSSDPARTEPSPDSGADATAPAPPDYTPGVVGSPALPGQLDLLFMIDNSASMSDKQQALSLAAADLMERLAQPQCLDGAGSPVARVDADGACPAGSQPEFVPFDDLHVAVISSSLGDGGAQSACPPNDTFPAFAPERVDMAHTLGSLPRGASLEANALGFLEWRRGEAPLASVAQQFADMVSAVGERGCGWEASLESWYRFLVDPFPYQGLERVRCPGSVSEALNCVAPATDGNGQLLLDEALLQQRQAFLRPQSAVAVVMLTDENDCSFQPEGQRWVVLNLDDQRPMFRSSSVCADNPNDVCCYSCPIGRLYGVPEGCGELDPVCEAGADQDILRDRLSNLEDGRNLRCYDQRRRFGIDFLYPTQRYVNALTQAKLCWSRPDLDPAQCEEDTVPNPLYAQGRSSNSVFLSGILGVPWQDIAAPQGAESAAALRYQSSQELASNGAWDVILGDPGQPAVTNEDYVPTASGTAPVPPSDPLMIESPFARPGVGINPINGREYDTAQAASGIPDDLQYACIFPLPEPRDCSLLDPVGDLTCDCFAGSEDKPLCEEEPGVSTPGSVQYWAKAYPARRQLQVLKGYGDNAVVSSICARNMTDPAQPDFGYRPAAAALVEALSTVEVAE